MEIIYHSLFGSHLQYGAQLWGQGKCVNRNNIQKLQNRALRKVTFKKLHDPVNPFYKDLNILKFKDLFHLQRCLFVSQIEQNQTLSKSFVNLKHCDCGDYQTWASSKRLWTLLAIRQILVVLIQQNMIVLWIGTSLKGSFLTSQKLTRLKSLITQYFLNKY